MGLHLIALAVDIQWAWHLLMTIIALGMVIFVHELGHFVVAKWCGVKVEKFYLGFDIAGLRFCKFARGETEYGIGILPLGGYVKMLGQEDNPSRLREEIERARLHQAQQAVEKSGADGLSAAPTAAAQPPDEGRQPEIAAADAVQTQQVIAAAERALFDPRSYLAKSVPLRMAIISAGVIMNLIFAFLMAAAAYWFGVRQVACGVGEVLAGESGWQANLRGGDEILEIGGKKAVLFRDLMAGISLGKNIEQGIPLVIRRPGVSQPLTVTVVPDRTRDRPTIGITSPRTTVLSTEGRPAFPGSPADLARPMFLPGDRIAAIDGVPIENPVDLEGQLALHPEKPLRVTVQRHPARPAEANSSQTAAQQLTIEVAPNRMRRLGLVMEMGEISAVQADSPAAKAGIRPGDFLYQIDGQPPGDPITLPDRLRRRAGQTVTLSLVREAVKEPLEIPVSLRQVTWIEAPLALGDPTTVPALGIAYWVLNRVHAVIEGSPAASAEVRPGDVIVRAVLLPPDKYTLPANEIKQEVLKVDLGAQQRNWPAFFHAMQNSLAGSRVELSLENGRKVGLEPVPLGDCFIPDRGFLFEPKYLNQKAGSLGEALELGARETIDSTMIVFTVLGKLGTQISPKALSGPWEIFKAASHAAQEGITRLLLFLTMLSANLAVLNFLPIPVLDGGHMVFLAWEAVRRKPASERVQLVLTYLGLIFILSLMLWVIALDMGLISRS